MRNLAGSLLVILALSACGSSGTSGATCSGPCSCSGSECTCNAGGTCTLGPTLTGDGGLQTLPTGTNYSCDSRNMCTITCGSMCTSTCAGQSTCNGETGTN